jgi:hypothetical protein
MSGRSILPPEIVEGLTRLRSAAQGPFGPPPFRALVRNHVELFAALQRLGASWRQIAGLLADAGIAGNNGQPISEAVLRATCSDARRQAGPPAPGTALRVGDAGHGETRRNETHRNETQFPETMRRETQRSETMRLEQRRDEAQRNETIRNEMQGRQARQTDALHPIAVKHAIDGSPHEPPQSHRVRVPPPGLDDQLLQRAARIRHLKEDHHG